jgi:hypothetical protein
MLLIRRRTANFKIPEGGGIPVVIRVKFCCPGFPETSHLGRKWDFLTGIGTSIAFQNPKFQGSLSPTKGDSEPRQTENLSDIFSIPRGTFAQRS